MNKSALVSILSIFFAVIIALQIGVTSSFAYSGGPINPYAFSAVSGGQSGTVKVMWYDDGNENQFNLLYGTDPSHFSYGQVALPSVHNAANSFMVGYLTPGTIYYFSLAGFHGASSTSSGPIMAMASGGNTVSPNVNQSLLNSHNTQSGIPYDFRVAQTTAGGTVNLLWTDNGTADQYDIVYGTKPGQYDYGVQNISFSPNNANVYSVGALKQNTVYYFALVAEKNNTVITWTNPISSLAR